VFSRPLTDEEMTVIGSSLDTYHQVFFTFWELAAVRFTDRMPTAAIQFFPSGNPEMLINETFWDSLTHNERLFVVCHECLHVILNHDERNGKAEFPHATSTDINRAQDITINHMICDLFGYNRDDLREWKKYCWIETCFDDPTQIKRNETFLYYLEMLLKHPKKDGKMPETVDQHPDSSKPNSGDRVPLGDLSDDLKADIIGQLADDLSPEEIEKLVNASPEMRAGLGAGNLLFEIDMKKRTPRKLKFASIVKKLKRTRMKPTPVDVESFTRVDRRFDSLGKEITLPGKYEGSKPTRDRLLIFLFMDISGSCLPHVDTFKKVYAAFAAEEHIFEIRLFMFDTRVTELTGADPRGFGGGGTNFGILEKKVQELKGEYHGKYPDCVVIVTDGEGTPVHPEAATRWVWLLTPGWNMRTYIPNTSRVWTIDQVLF